MEAKRDVMIVRVRVGDMTGVAVTPSYLFDQDVVRVWIPELDECRIGEVVGDYQKMSQAKAEVAASINSIRTSISHFFIQTILLKGYT